MAAERDESVPKPIRMLRNLGPLPTEALPTTPGPLVRRDYDIRELDPHSGPATRASIPNTKSVYYLHDEHDLTEVVETWLRTNEEKLRDHARFNRTSLSYALTGAMQDAWREVRDREQWSWIPEREQPHDMTDQPSGEDRQSITCPRCGEDTKNLGHHIHGPNCNPEDDE